MKNKKNIFTIIVFVITLNLVIFSKVDSFFAMNDSATLATPSKPPSRIYVVEPSIHDRGDVAFFRLKYLNREYIGYLGRLRGGKSAGVSYYEYGGFVYLVDGFEPPIPAPANKKETLVE